MIASVRTLITVIVMTSSMSVHPPVREVRAKKSV
jgi:hypothetical protein